VTLEQRARAALRRDPAEAARLIGRLKARARRADDVEGLARAQLLRAELDLLSGRAVRASHGFAEAARGSRTVRLAAGLGAIQAHAQAGDAGAVRSGIRSLRRHGGDAFQTAVCESAIAGALSALGDDAGAERSLVTAVKSLARRRDTRSATVRATARHNLAVRLARRGAVAEALKELSTAEGTFRRLGLDAWVARAVRNRGWVLGLAGRAEEAFAQLADARAAFEARGDKRSAALVRLDEAELALRLGAFARADDDARKAARSLPPLEAGRAQLVAARSCAGLGRKATARRTAQRAREVFAAAGDRTGRAMADVVLGNDLARAERTLRETGHWLAALEALAARAPRPATLRRALPRYPAPLRRWLEPQLHAAQARGRLRIRNLRRAYRAAERLRALAPTTALRAHTLAAHAAIYTDLATELIARGTARDRREAFLVIDALRARTLRDRMEREAPGLALDPRLRSLRQRLESLWRALEREDTDTGDRRAAGLAVYRELAACEREFIRHWERGQRSPAVASAGARLPSTPCLSLAVLANGRVAVLYAADGAVEAWDAGSARTLRDGIDAFEFQVNRRLYGADDPATALRILREMSSRVIGSRRVADRLCVVLPPELGRLPVEALPALEHARIAQVPYSTGSSTGWDGGATLLVGIESERLKDVRGEIGDLRRRFPAARVLAGPAARREAILDGIAGHRLIHIAGHAHARDDLPPLSGLRVADGWVTATDLGATSLDGALVVLSACRTGDPSLRWNGESLGGFPRALLGAGAAGVIASRWEIVDSVARAWMRAFYDGLRDGPPDEALWCASRRMRRTCPHPADWAAFQCTYGGAQGRDR
jgi:tetratricopeptide (TPR) repeat protein